MSQSIVEKIDPIFSEANPSIVDVIGPFYDENKENIDPLMFKVISFSSPQILLKKRKK